MIKKGIATLLILLNLSVHAAEPQATVVSPATPEAAYAYWIFSGTVTNENNEQFGYFFQMQKKDTVYTVKTALMDEQTHTLLFYYDGTQEIPTPTENKWKIDHAFLRFNPINHSWVFGVKMPDKQGFNFKIDLLNPADEVQTLRPGFNVLVHQTNRLNGHLQTPKQDKEQFVTANNAWFSKAWISQDQTAPHVLTSGFCRFQDGSGFYTENLLENDAKRAALASWRDPLGNVAKMSQFVSLLPGEEHTWLLKVAIPKLALPLTNILDKASGMGGLIAGFLPKQQQGFCFFTEQSFLEEKPIKVG